MDEYQERIAADISRHPIIVYMKGTKLMPSCGFSARVVEILNTLKVPYVTRNVLEDPNLRAAIKVFSKWPTLPQLYIDGTFIGGCDIVMEMYQNGELEKLVQSSKNQGESH